jgi:hypothetical protein
VVLTFGSLLITLTGAALLLTNPHDPPAADQAGSVRFRANLHPDGANVGMRLVF